MERYKKRTIALCLASALTVIGAFGAENYDNTLMALKVNVGSGGYVNLTAFTEKPYKSPIKTTKVDDNTFVVTLKDTNNSAQEPDIEDFDNIESIQISTYPYTTTSDGCTRIVIKTNGEPQLIASKALFIPDNKQPILLNVAAEEDDEPEEKNYSENENSSNYNDTIDNKNNDSNNVSKSFTPPDYTKIKTENNSFEYMTVILCISILLVIIGLIYMFSRDRMSSVVGERDELELEEKDTKSSKTKTKKLRNTINKLDKTYQPNASSTDFLYNKEEEANKFNAKEKESDSDNEKGDIIVDLDELYQKSQQVSSTIPEETHQEDDLAELLNSFSFENKEPEEPEEETFDENLYNQIINNSSIRFKNADIKKINQLLLAELSEETANELDKYRKTPKKKPLTQEQILEDILTTYSIKRNIDFSEQDVDAIKRLMNVELGEDFIKDYTTNPVRTKIVEKEILENAGHKPMRTSEIMTMNVKDMLPDLLLELKKQGDKKIKSEVKPIVVYYSEGYEYKKLKVSDELSNITKNIDKNQNIHKESYHEPIVASGYDVSTLSIKDSMPDLADIKTGLKKYGNQIENKPQVNEKDLLKSLSNVTFKPFYEDVEKELNKFDNFEIINSDSEENPPEQKEEIFEKELINTKENKKDNDTENLLQLIEAQQAERELKKQTAEDAIAFEKEYKISIEEKNEHKQQSETYNLDGTNYIILKTIKCTPNSECKIIKSDNNYVVIGNINNREIILKQFNSLNKGNMQIRQNDKTDNTIFLVKIDSHKFIIKITKDNMEFVMDLC